jgi:hypothetical protein
MQFAGGRSIAQLAEEWQRDGAWVEESVRRALLASIPRRDGGLKPSRAEVRADRSGELAGIRDAQGELDLGKE